MGTATNLCCLFRPSCVLLRSPGRGSRQREGLGGLQSRWGDQRFTKIVHVEHEARADFEREIGVTLGLTRHPAAAALQPAGRVQEHIAPGGRHGIRKAQS